MDNPPGSSAVVSNRRAVIVGRAAESFVSRGVKKKNGGNYVQAMSRQDCRHGSREAHVCRLAGSALHAAPVEVEPCVLHTHWPGLRHLVAVRGKG